METENMTREQFDSEQQEGGFVNTSELAPENAAEESSDLLFDKPHYHAIVQLDDGNVETISYVRKSALLKALEGVDGEIVTVIKGKMLRARPRQVIDFV